MWGYAHCHWANPSCPGPGGLKSSVWKICKIATPCPPGSHIQVILGLHGGNTCRQAWRVLRGWRGSAGGSQSPGRPSQSPSLMGGGAGDKDLTHREAQPLKAELVKGKEGVGGIVPGLVGTSSCPLQHIGPGIWMVLVLVGTGAFPGFCSYNTFRSCGYSLRS